MSHALEQINAARIGVIRQSASSKLPTSCLHGYAVSLPRNTPDCPGCNNLHVALEKIEQCPFSLPGGPCRYRAWCGTSHWGDGTSYWNKLGLTYLPPARMKVTHLTTIRPNMQEAPEGDFWLPYCVRVSLFCFSLYLLGWILWKLWRGAICRLTLKNVFLLQKKHRQQQHQIPFDVVAMRKNDWRCLKNDFAFSGPNQAHDLTNILYSWMSFQACCWRGHLPGCFNAPHFLLSLVQL